MNMPTKPPTRREREIINAVFALGNRASAEEIRARLTNPPGDSSVRVMLTRLEKKGLLKHRQEGLRYSATISPVVARRTALQQYVHSFFWGLSQADDDRTGCRCTVDRRGTGRAQDRD